MNGQRLDNRVVVIVGGTSGLGLSAALACKAAGARVVVVGRKAEPLRAAVEALGDAGHEIVGDATEPQTAERAIAAALTQFGRLDGLYHVAGGSGRLEGDGPLDAISDRGWHATLEENLTSLFYSNRAAAAHFLRAGHGGSVLNMGSVLGWAPAPRHFATHAYAAAKAAVIGLTRAAAAYYAPRQIRFNVVAPGLIETPMSQRAAGDPEIRAYAAARQPLAEGGIGQPRHVDDAVVYFLSDESRFVTGQVLAVDGGWSVSDATVL